MTNQPTNQPTRTRRNALAGFDVYQLLAIRILIQALQDSEARGKGQMALDMLDIADAAGLLRWLGTEWAGVLWDVAGLPWCEKPLERWRFLQTARTRLLEL